MKRAITLEVIVALLIMLFLYASFSKYANFPLFKRSMQMQGLQPWLFQALIFGLPPMEIVIAMGLIFNKTRKAALYTFLSLMLLFSGYIFAILVKWIPKRPCSCGGVIEALSWEQHFVFNLVFLFLAVWAIWLQKELKKQNTSEIKIF